MNRSTFYIEYLIVATFTILALVVVSDPKSLTDVSTLKILTLLPLAYVAGLVVEALGVIPEEILRFASGDDLLLLKNERRSRKNKTRKSGDASSRTADIFAWNADVGEELKLRRSRDRVARGTFMTGIIFYLYLEWTNTPLSFAAWSASIADCRYWILAILTLLVVIWIFLHNSTRSFKDAAHALARSGGKRVIPTPLYRVSPVARPLRTRRPGA